MLDVEFEAFTARLGYQFNDVSLLHQALTHRSFAFEKKPHLPHNERFELLGDAVLSLVITDVLFKRYPDHSEGDLSKARSAIVSEAALARLALDLQLNLALRLGKGEMSSGGAMKPRLLSSTFEAVVGAVYLDGSLTAAMNFIQGRLGDLFEGVLEPASIALDYKTRLQELVQSKYKILPKYLVVGEDGPPHLKNFAVEVSINNKVLGSGKGRSKKEAEQAAAQEAWGSISTNGEDT